MRYEGTAHLPIQRQAADLLMTQPSHTPSFIIERFFFVRKKFVCAMRANIGLLSCFVVQLFLWENRCRDLAAVATHALA